MPSLLDKRLVLVTGKGGVGKTTVAAALGLAAARRGKRVIVCEVARETRLAALLDLPAEGYDEHEAEPGLYGMSVDPDRAKREWLQHQLKSGTLAGILGHSRVFGYLTAAAPGLNELVTIGKVWDLAQLERRTGDRRYDLVILDAPATGHGLALFVAPRTYARVAAAGPVRRQALRIHDFLTDRRATGVLGVALPEEMPVNETLDLERGLHEELRLGFDAVVVNALLPDRLTREQETLLESLDERLGRAARAAVATALSEDRRARLQRAELRRLRQSVDGPVVTLPYVFEPDIGRAELDALSKRLGGLL
ncbi:MAG TPA: ArsA-related P-loop ATPase [Thermoleophilaceae bacterium]